MKMVCVMFLALVAIAGCGGIVEKTEEEGTPPAEVRAVPVKIMKLQPTLELSGVLTSIPENNAVLSSPLAGQVKSIGVHEGQTVNAGDTLVELDTRVAESDLARASAALREMKATLSLLKHGPMPGEIESARQESLAAAEQARALLAKRAALKPLHDRGEISDVQFEQAASAAASAEAIGASAAEHAKMLQAGTRPEAIEEAEAKVASAQADVDAQQLALSLSAIQSPLNGVIAELPVRMGMAIERSVLIARVVDLRSLYAQIRIPAPYRTQVREGSPARLRLSGTEVDLSGNLCRIGVEADGQTGDVDAFVLVGNDEGTLQPGLACDVAISLPETPERLAVPIDAITNQNGETVVTVIRDEKAEQVAVEVGEKTNEFVAITKGVEAGDLVATEGGYGLPDGTPVHIIQDAA